MATVIRAARIDGAPVVLALQSPLSRNPPAAPMPEPVRVEQAPAVAREPIVDEPPPRTPAEAALLLAQQDSLLRESIAMERQRVLDEARDPEGSEYGLDRLAEILRGCGNMTPNGIIQTCLADLERFQGGARRTDDLTLLVVRSSDAWVYYEGKLKGR